jgi:hypothetical protein
MLPVIAERALPPAAEGLVGEVESLLNPAEAEGVFRDGAECLVLLLFTGAFLLAPPTPRPKRG